MNVLDTAGLLLFIFYAVSFTKEPFALLVKDPANQAWTIRLWALVLGIGAALVDSHFGNDAAWSGPAVYNAIKEGGAAAVGAIITYHIGNGDFVSVFDGPNDTMQPNGGNTVAGAPVRDVVPKDTTAKEPAKPVDQGPSLTPAQEAGKVDLTTVLKSS